MVLIVLKIQDLLSLIHLHYLEFQRQGFLVMFHLVFFPRIEEAFVVDTNLWLWLNCREVPGSYFENCKDPWRKIP